MGKKPLKKEPETPCLAAATDVEKGKNTSNAMANKLRKAPSFVRQYYDSKVKYMKFSSKEKEEFTKEVLQGDFNSEYFSRMQDIKIKEGDSSVDQWMSWKEVSDTDGPQLVRAHLIQGTLVTRPHIKLDPDAPSTLELPPETRLQYARNTESTFKENTDTTTLNRGKDGIPPEFVEVKQEQEYKEIVALVNKGHNVYQSGLIKSKIDLAKFDGNEYCDKQTILFCVVVLIPKVPANPQKF